MKNSIFYILLLSATIFASCGGNNGNNATAEAEAATQNPESTQTVGSAQIYAIDLANSVANWKASKITGSSHTGKFKMDDGRLAMSDGKVIAGELKVDMKSLVITDDTPDGGKAKLAGHLMSGDFFDAETHPVASFMIKKTQPIDPPQNGYNYTFTGMLLLKGTDAPISVPANVAMEGQNVRVTTPPFILDRTKWGVSYGSGLAGAVGDNIINDEVEMQMNIIFVPN